MKHSLRRLLKSPAFALTAIITVVTSAITMDGNSNNDPIWVEDFPEADAKIPPLRRMKYLGPGYFATMGNPVIAGRDLTWHDSHSGAAVALLSENLAREYWGEPAKAIGKRVRRTSKTGWVEIVGVVGNERQDGATKPAPATIYWPMRASQGIEGQTFVQRSLAYVIRSSRLQSPGFLGEVQKAVWSVNPNLPLARVRTLQQSYEQSMAQTQFVLVILGIAASVTLLLGLIAAAALMRRLSSLLYGVNPFDPLTYFAVAASLGAVALVATWLPARQATRIDPMLALRAE